MLTDATGRPKVIFDALQVITGIKCIFLHAKYIYILAAQNIYIGSFDPTLRL